MVAKNATDKSKLAPVKVQTRKKEVRYMTVAQWHAVPSNPRQPRDQVLRAPRATHLHKFVPGLHEEVYMAEDPKGNNWKLTAHTRGEVWVNGLSDVVPSRVCVTIIPVRDEEEAGRLCLLYDSREAVNTSADLIHGAMVYYGIPMTSPMFKTAKGLASPLRYAYEIAVASYRQLKDKHIQEKVATLTPVSRATAMDYVDSFRAELAALDAINPGGKRGKARLFASPLMTAYLLASLRHGAENVMSFFEKMQDGNCGLQKGKKRDPIGYVENLLDKREGKARHEHLQTTAKILGAIEVYMQGNFTARDADGKSTYQPKICIENVTSVDLDVYLIRSNARRTGRQSERNSILKNKNAKGR